MIGMFLMQALAVYALTGCMQITGIQEMDAWGLKIKSTTGFEVAAGVQQYDTVIDKRGINPEKNNTTKLEKY